MQDSLDSLRNTLWDKLRPYFDKYINSQGEVKNSNLEELFRDIFQESTQQDIDYAVRNMHRLDTDGSGAVSFSEFVVIWIFRLTSFSKCMLER